MLLDPSKEQLDLATIIVYIRDRQSREVEVVGQEHEPPARLGIAVADATQAIGVEPRCPRAVEDDRLVAAQPRGLVHPAGRASTEVEVGLGPSHEERQAPRQAMK